METCEILNLGCGNSSWGTERVDVVKTNTTTKVMDLNNHFDLPSGHYDKIYCNKVLEHIKNLGTFIDECYRVLKKDGKFYMRTDYAGYILFHVTKSREHNNIWTPNCDVDGHYHLFTESHLKLLFKKFRNLQVTYDVGGRNWFNRILLKLIPFKLGNIHITITGEK